MGSFILRTPFNRSVPLARRARRYQSILFARRKTGKAKNDALPPKVRMVASDGKRVSEPSHHDSPVGPKMGEPSAYVPENKQFLSPNVRQNIFQVIYQLFRRKPVGSKAQPICAFPSRERVPHPLDLEHVAIPQEIERCFPLANEPLPL